MADLGSSMPSNWASVLDTHNTHNKFRADTRSDFPHRPTVMLPCHAIPAKVYCSARSLTTPLTALAHSLTYPFEFFSAFGAWGVAHQPSAL